MQGDRPRVARWRSVSLHSASMASLGVCASGEEGWVEGKAFLLWGGFGEGSGGNAQCGAEERERETDFFFFFLD